jgi:hypothetical protein
MNILDDAQARPDLFQSGRGVDAALIAEWALRNKCLVPKDIVELWCKFGTGTAFETEELFGLDSDPITGESAEILTQWYHDQGLQGDLILIHRGFNGLTALQKSTGNLLQINQSTMLPVRSFSSVDEWYVPIRAEFALRYQLDSSLSGNNG